MELARIRTTERTGVLLLSAEGVNSAHGGKVAKRINGKEEGRLGKEEGEWGRRAVSKLVRNRPRMIKISVGNSRRKRRSESKKTRQPAALPTNQSTEEVVSYIRIKRSLWAE